MKAPAPQPQLRVRARWALGTLVILSTAVAIPAVTAASARRVVSLNPSLTAILLALGAADRLVGVDDFSARQRPELTDVPRVGGLYDPSLEAVLAVSPDLVVLVPSAEQRDFSRSLEELGVAVERFENIRFEQVLENVARLGALTGRDEVAAERVGAIRRAREEVEARARERAGPPPLVVLVLQREPLYVVGRGSFLDEMLAAVGARNAGAAFEEPYPRATAEWLVAAAPDVVLDASPDAQEPADYWARFPSLPALRTGRVVRVDPERVTLPGPYLDRALRDLSRAVAARPAIGGDAAR